MSRSSIIISSADGQPDEQRKRGRSSTGQGIDVLGVGMASMAMGPSGYTRAKVSRKRDTASSLPVQHHGQEVHEMKC